MSIVNNKSRPTSVCNNFSNFWVHVGSNAKNSTMLWFVRFDILGLFCVDLMCQDTATPGVDIRVYGGREFDLFTRMAKYEFIRTGPVTLELAIK